MWFRAFSFSTHLFQYANKQFKIFFAVFFKLPIKIIGRAEMVALGALEETNVSRMQDFTIETLSEVRTATRPTFTNYFYTLILP